MGNYNCSSFKTSKVISYPLFCENSNLSALQEQGRTDRVQDLSYTPNPHRNPTPAYQGKAYWGQGAQAIAPV